MLALDWLSHNRTKLSFEAGESQNKLGVWPGRQKGAPCANASGGVVSRTDVMSMKTASAQRLIGDLNPGFTDYPVLRTESFGLGTSPTPYVERTPRDIAHSINAPPGSRRAC